jgi:hypothetical protein
MDTWLATVPIENTGMIGNSQTHCPFARYRVQLTRCVFVVCISFLGMSEIGSYCFSTDLQ